MTENSVQNRIKTSDVQAILKRFSFVYKYKAPHYQAAMLNDLRRLWLGHPHRLLDIGGGTGLIGQCMAELLACGSVTSIDLHDRFHPCLAIATKVYDGKALPFADNSFDAATLINVIYHIPPERRPAALWDIRRTVAGPVYLKDHLPSTRLDIVRLSALDVIGNVPFGGMVRAAYLTMADWEALAAKSGFRIAASAASHYRSGVYAAAFPNRLEITMRWEPA